MTARRKAILDACCADGRALAALAPTRAELEEVTWLLYFYVTSPVGLAALHANTAALDLMGALGVQHTPFVSEKTADWLWESGAPDAIDELRRRGLLTRGGRPGSLSA